MAYSKYDKVHFFLDEDKNDEITKYGGDKYYVIDTRRPPRDVYKEIEENNWVVSGDTTWYERIDRGNENFKGMMKDIFIENELSTGGRFD